MQIGGNERGTLHRKLQLFGHIGKLPGGPHTMSAFVAAHHVLHIYAERMTAERSNWFLVPYYGQKEQSRMTTQRVGY